MAVLYVLIGSVVVYRTMPTCDSYTPDKYCCNDSNLHLSIPGDVPFYPHHIS